MNEFECGYINKPYCALRPFSNCPSCPKFSCPPPLNCHNPCSSPCFHNNCSPFPFCCPPHQDFCQPPFQPCQPFPCNPCQSFPCNPCQPLPCNRPVDCFQPCNPMNSLIWFYGGYRCGNKRSCHSNTHK